MWVVTSMIGWILIAFLVERAQVLVCGDNYGAPWNGIGAVDGVLRRDTPAPMAYRVLVPWLLLPARALKLPLLESYEILKVLLIALALLSVDLAFGRQAALLTAALLPATFLYDYWDWAPELAGICLAMTGDIRLAIPGLALHGLSRETAPLAALAYGLKTGDVEGTVFLLLLSGCLWVLVRLVQGRHKLYCKRVMLGANLQALREWRAYRPAWLSSLAVSVVITAAALAVAPLFGPAGLVPVLLAGAGWTLARAEETRVFSSLLPWIAYGYLRLWM
jgi:hypothetical protein